MRWIALGLAAVLGAAMASAGRTEQAPSAQPQKWQVSDEGARCAISTGDRATGYLSVRVIPGNVGTEVYVVGPTELLRRQRDSKVTLTFAPGGESFQDDVVQYQSRYDGLVLKMFVSPAFEAALGRGGALQLLGLDGPVSLPIAGSAKAVSWLRRCADDKLAKWGIDPGAYNSLTVPPRITNDDWLREIDYPDSALVRAKEGEVVVRLDVDASGKVTNCAIVSSGGWGPTDRSVCARALIKANFEPAIGPVGQPVAASRTLAVSFRIADSEYEAAHMPPQ